MADLNEQIKYLGSLNLVVYYNSHHFFANEFGGSRIEKLSTIKSLQVDEYRPTWVQALVQKDILNDEIDYFQYGQQEEIYFNSFSLS